VADLHGRSARGRACPSADTHRHDDPDHARQSRHDNEEHGADHLADPRALNDALADDEAVGANLEDSLDELVEFGPSVATLSLGRRVRHEQVAIAERNAAAVGPDEDVEHAVDVLVGLHVEVDRFDLVDDFAKPAEGLADFLVANLVFVEELVELLPGAVVDDVSDFEPGPRRALGLGFRLA